MRHFSLSAILGAGIMLTSCVTPEQVQKVYDSQVAPTGAIKTAVVKHVRETFYDPYSLRDAQISNVLSLPGTDLKAVCIRANGKNRFGAYVGLSYTSVRIRGGVAVSSLQDAPACADSRLKFYPFPELENI